MINRKEGSTERFVGEGQSVVSVPNLPAGDPVLLGG